MKKSILLCLLLFFTVFSYVIITSEHDSGIKQEDKGMAVYWIGQDGNAYYKGDDGKVANYGKPDGGSSDSQIRFYKEGYGNLSRDAKRIADPMAGQGQVQGASTTAAAPTQTKQAPQLNQAAVDATVKAEQSLGVEQDTGYRNIDDSFNSLLSRYNKEAERNEGDYTEGVETNTSNLQKNKQNALVAAAQGRRGLRGTLSALGALSGDGGVLADRAVTTSANQDIGEAADTFATNAQGLDKAIKNFRDEDKDRRSEAETTRTNQRTALEGSIASKRQNYFQKLAEIFGQADQTGAANDWLGKAGGLNNEIASKSRVVSTAFAPRAAAFTPGDLESYLAGAGDMTVDVDAGGMGADANPSSIVAGRRKKEERELVPATA